MNVVLKCYQKHVVFAYWNICIYFNSKYFILEFFLLCNIQTFKIAFKLDFFSCCEKFHFQFTVGMRMYIS